VVIFRRGAATAFESALRWLSPYQLLLRSVAISVLALALLVVLGGRAAGLVRMSRRALLRAALLGALNPGTETTSRSAVGATVELKRRSGRTTD